MKIEIESTDEIVEFDGVPCRHWIGRLPDGSTCDVFVHRIGGESPELAAELAEQLAPRALGLTFGFMGRFTN